MIDDGYGVTWYDADGKKIGTGNRLENDEKEGVYYYEIVLSEALASEYRAIEGRQKITVSEDVEQISVTLRRLPEKVVSGCLTDEDGIPVTSADILVVQNFAGGVVSEKEYSVDSQGRFTLPLKAASTQVYFFADGYYGRVESLSPADVEASASVLSKVMLKAVGNNKITLKITERNRKRSEEDETVSSVSSLAGFEITIYNITQENTSSRIRFRGQISI